MSRTGSGERGLDGVPGNVGRLRLVGTPCPILALDGLDIVLNG
jgi:hypothetical protein